MRSSEDKAFGELLGQFRVEARLTQQHLAKLTGRSRGTIVNWENGTYLPKERALVLELAKHLHLDSLKRDQLLEAALLDPLGTIWTIPFRRNPFFTGREQELKHLHEQLGRGKAATVGQAQSISGLGGIGKTQLAVEYAYRHRDEYQYVLWAHAESAGTLTASFTGFAGLLNLLEKDTQEREITIQAVKRWLQRQQGWLLILDNADSPGLLSAFLPPTLGGHLLITTRAADLSTQMAGFAHSLVVDSFSDEQGALFLLHRSGLLALDAPLDQAETYTRQLAMEVSHELGGLPLALDQAGAYLTVTGSSLATYQQIYRQHRARLLQERRGADHPESVVATWTLPFSKVEQQNLAAADLLRLCAFLASDAIPEEILTGGAETLGPILAPVAADPFLLNEAIESLRAYSLISRDPQAQTLTIHRLVQAVLLENMSAEAQQQWKQRAVHAVSAAYPGQDFAHWPMLEHLLPHMLICTIWIEQVPLATSEAALLLTQAGCYLLDRSRYGEAEPLLKRALVIREQQLGAEHPDTATSLHNLAKWYQVQGKYTQAEPLYIRALSILEQQLGPEHPDTATSLNDLAELYRMREQYAQAEPLYIRALSILERQLGPEHPNVAYPLNGLANLYYEQGKYSEAEPLYQRALHIWEQQLGPEHPATAEVMHNLAQLREVQDNSEEARALYTRALLVREQALGTQHPNTTETRARLIALLRAMGQQEEATQLETVLLSS